MANIFQRIIYTPFQCGILDLIKKNADSVTYHKTIIKDDFGIQIGCEHYVKIATPCKELTAKLVKKNGKVESESYCFVCEKRDCNKPCWFQNGRPFAESNNAFVSKVYTTMLNHYVARHGLPDNQY